MRDVLRTVEANQDHMLAITVRALCDVTRLPESHGSGSAFAGPYTEGKCRTIPNPSERIMNPTSLPEQTPEDVQEQMRDTRAHMTGQIHALEDKVIDMAHDATAAVTSAVRGVRDAVHTATEQVRSASESALATVRRVVDVRRHVRRRPWLAVGGAIALGFVCARLIDRR